jgi:hypothetical protein
MYYIKTCTNNGYELSKAFDSKKDAEKKLNNMRGRNKRKSEIIAIPFIRDGLNLYRDGKYYKTIVGEAKYIWLLQRYDDANSIPDMVLKDHLIDWFVKGIVDSTEDYNDDLDFHDLEDDDEDAEDIKENEDE